MCWTRPAVSPGTVPRTYLYCNRPCSWQCPLELAVPWQRPMGEGPAASRAPQRARPSSRASSSRCTPHTLTNGRGAAASGAWRRICRRTRLLALLGGERLVLVPVPADASRLFARCLQRPCNDLATCLHHHPPNHPPNHHATALRAPSPLRTPASSRAPQCAHSDFDSAQRHSKANRTSLSGGQAYLSHSPVRCKWSMLAVLSSRLHSAAHLPADARDAHSHCKKDERVTATRLRQFDT